MKLRCISIDIEAALCCARKFLLSPYLARGPLLGFCRQILCYLMLHLKLIDGPLKVSVTLGHLRVFIDGRHHGLEVKAYPSHGFEGSVFLGISSTLGLTLVKDTVMRVVAILGILKSTAPRLT